MREIKFRAWDKNSKKMSYGCECLPPFRCNDKEDIWIMQQYTGLKDKNGKEIYEGDFVATKQRDVIFEVYMGWAEDTEDYGWSFRTATGAEQTYSVDKSITTLEIIGNFYENPEIMEGK